MKTDMVRHTNTLHLAYQNPNPPKRRGKLEAANSAARYSLSLMSDEYLAMLDFNEIKVIGLGYNKTY